MDKARLEAIAIVEQAKKDCFWSEEYDIAQKLDRVIDALKFKRKWWKTTKGWLNLETGQYHNKAKLSY